MIELENSIQFVDKDSNTFNITKSDKKAAKIYVNAYGTTTRSKDSNPEKAIRGKDQDFYATRKTIEWEEGDDTPRTYKVDIFKLPPEIPVFFTLRMSKPKGSNTELGLDTCYGFIIPTNMGAMDTYVADQIAKAGVTTTFGKEEPVFVPVTEPMIKLTKDGEILDIPTEKEGCVSSLEDLGTVLVYNARLKMKLLNFNMYPPYTTSILLPFKNGDHRTILNIIAKERWEVKDTNGKVMESDTINGLKLFDYGMIEPNSNELMLVDSNPGRKFNTSNDHLVSHFPMNHLYEWDTEEEYCIFTPNLAPGGKDAKLVMKNGDLDANIPLDNYFHEEEDKKFFGNKVVKFPGTYYFTGQDNWPSGDEITISYWVKGLNTRATMYYVSHSYTGDFTSRRSGYAIGRGSRMAFVLGSFRGQNLEYDIPTRNDDEWHMYTATKNLKTGLVKVYFDSKLEKTSVDVVDPVKMPNWPTGTISIGALSTTVTNNLPMGGYKVWSKELSQSEIDYEYTNANAMAGSPYSTTAFLDITISGFCRGEVI